jgi:hypothetical protein
LAEKKFANGDNLLNSTTWDWISIKGVREMRWDILAVFGIVFGFLLIIKGFDTLTEWRAWFFGISGLVLFLLGILRAYLRIRRIGSHKGPVEAKS